MLLSISQKRSKKMVPRKKSVAEECRYTKSEDHQAESWFAQHLGISTRLTSWAMREEANTPYGNTLGSRFMKRNTTVGDKKDGSV